MGAQFPAVELDNAIRFSTLSRMTGLLWYSSKWPRCFGRFLQYTPQLEMLVLEGGGDAETFWVYPYS